jgi:hypothetical protein
MMRLFNLVCMTKKELIDLLIIEKRTSYRKGYKAGAAMKYRHTPVTVYGDSLPIKEMPEVTVHIGDVGPVGTNTVTDDLHYT